MTGRTDERRTMRETTRIDLGFVLNGKHTALSVEPRELLIDTLRTNIGLTGTKRSCDVQICGACTVLVDGSPISSCTFLTYEVNGRTVETIEGLAGDEGLHPLQEAFIEKGGFQCGFCTPGMIMTAKALLAENPDPSREEIAGYLDGNICRCTGYQKIFKSVETAADMLDE